MNLYYEEAGAFKVGRVLQEQGNAYQVETLHGKRTKVKSNSVMLKFDALECAEFHTQVEALAKEVDTEFLWECSPEGEFDFTAMAQEYFGEKPTVVQQAATLAALHAAPIHFHRKGKGMYRAAPPEILQAALAGLEKKRLAAEQQQAWADALVRRELPDGFAKQAATLLVRPDKNSAEYKALMLACTEAGRSPDVLLIECGAFKSVHEMMRARFAAVYFPKGPEIDLPAPEVPAELAELPLANVRAFSIDDISTTEIDDAFSVVWLDEKRARIGVHIAAPALLIPRGSPYDRVARERLSTVYAPGDKITMLPDQVVELATLAEGRTVPSVSIYVEVSVDTGELISEPYSTIEQVPMAANLRHNHLDAALSKEVLEDPNLNELEVVGEFFPALKMLWKSSCVLRMEREIARGQPEKHTRIDFNFYVSDDGTVEIQPRRRDAPLDLLVAEWMIYVNREWGGMLDECKVTGIYRVQPPMGRVRMSTHAAPHVGLGVPQYAWSTSPLRRYVDLVNQQQLISLLRQEPPVYTATDAELLSAVNSFDVTYKAYAEFQQSMERYWCLRWIQQKGRKQFDGVVVKDELVRLDDIPLFVRLVGVTSPGRGVQVEVELDQVDELTLTVSCKLIALKKGTPTRLLDDDEEEDIELPEAPVAVIEAGESEGLSSSDDAVGGAAA
ncbi:ribonuclease catalytic domain-containing protein [Limnobacter sp.]|jgi:exoribonuclease-2|uniref:ribonuclease catalytic domain-containing protein n=1 Tax=Limnobacter sp. TaxID=2003368 RepID=UPI0025EC15DB|nr:RNB domain-containing ribonuclease [uncultured Limnobacter sp.]